MTGTTPSRIERLPRPIRWLWNTKELAETVFRRRLEPTTSTSSKSRLTVPEAGYQRTSVRVFRFPSLSVRGKSCGDSNEPMTW